MRVYKAEFYGVVLGGYAIVFAEDEAQAKTLLVAKLAETGLAPKQSDKDVTIVELTPTMTPNCQIIWNGDY